MKWIALDAMGGDYAPEQIVIGALEALPEMHHGIMLVGVETDISKCLKGATSSKIQIVHASEVVGMEEKPVEALRSKKNSSIAVCVNLVKEGRADAFVSAGNTGAVTAASLLGWRQIPGIRRPAIASAMPAMQERFLLLDAGASPDAEPEYLVEFAQMGRAYAKAMWGRNNPKVHLMNIGEEPGKGNAFAKAAYDALAKFDWFAGNIEGKDMYTSNCDVVVCDAFVGNIVLKSAEGTAEFMMAMIREQMPKGLMKLFYAPVRKVLKPIKRKMDYAEVGGSPLLGVEGLTFIAHGRSDARAIKNALLQAQRAIDSGLLEAIRTSVTEISGK